MKSTIARKPLDTVPVQRAAAASTSARTPAGQPFDASPRQSAQLKAMEGLRATSAHAGMPVQMGRKKKGNAAEEKKKQDSKRQSESDRKQNKLAAYSGDAWKHQQKVVKDPKKRREINDSLAGHASGNGGNKQNRATKDALKKIAKETAEAAQEEKRQARQAEANKRIGNWKKHFHDDKDDRGGAGNAHGILVK